MRTRMRPKNWRSCTTASSRISANYDASLRPRAPNSRPRSIPKVIAHLVTEEMKRRQVAGRGGQGGSAAAARRFRARLSVCRRGQSADRLRARARRSPSASARARCSRLRRHRACAVHRHGQLSRRRRLGDRHPPRRRGSRHQRQRSSSARCIKSQASVDANRQGQSSRISWPRKCIEQPEVRRACPGATTSIWRPSA